MNKSEKIIVIGGTAAGPSAAAKAKRSNPNADVIIYEAGNFISTGTCELPYLFSGDIKDYNDLVFFTPESFFKEKGVKVFVNHFVTKIDIKNKKLSVFNKSNNSTFEVFYDKLILTTGSIANELTELPFTLKNVFKLKSIDDYIRINDSIKTFGKKVLIIGAGYIGLEMADSLKSAGYDVTILEKSQLPMPSAEIEVRYLIKDILEKNNITFLQDEPNRKYITSENKFKQLKHSGYFIDFDFAIVTIGAKPNNLLASNAKLQLGNFGGLIVDNRLRTSNPNIYAAGDNIEVKNFITNKNDYIPLATQAHNYGHIAGANAAGENIIAQPIINNNVFKVFDNFIGQVGLSSRQANENNILIAEENSIAFNKVKIMPGASKVFGKIIYDKNKKTIIGASFVGSNEVSGYVDLISAMIYNKNSVFSLSNINFNYTPPLSPFINLLSILGRQIQEKYK